MNFNRFITIFGFSTVIILSAVLFINLIFDPLWYFGGNKYGKVNYAFNERISKLNLLKREKDVNCLIFGSSKVTFLKSSEITNAKCFNLSISAGRIEEFIELAHLIKKHYKFNIEYLFVGVESWDVFKSAYVADHPWQSIQMPKSFVWSYLSFDALRYSRRLFIEKSPIPRIYDENFNVSSIKDIGRFDPNNYFTKPPKAINLEVDSDVINKYLSLVDILRPTKTIYFSAPVSAWHVKRSSEAGKLKPFLEVMYEFKSAGYSVIDYSAISPMTIDTKYTWDGIHYYGPTSKMMTADFNQVIVGKPLIHDDFGLELSGLSLQKYNEIYQSILNDFQLESEY